MTTVGSLKISTRHADATAVFVSIPRTNFNFFIHITRLHGLAFLSLITAISLSPAQDDKAVLAALQAVDIESKADHFGIARADLDVDGDDDVFALMNGKSGYRGSGGARAWQFGMKVMKIHRGSDG